MDECLRTTRSVPVAKHRIVASTRDMDFAIVYRAPSRWHPDHGSNIETWDVLDGHLEAECVYLLLATWLRNQKYSKT